MQSLGADRVIDYNQEDFTLGSTTYDLVFDVVGNRSLSKCQQILAPKGIYVTTQPTPKSYWQSFLSAFSRQKAKVILLQSSSLDLIYLKELIEAGQVRSIIDRVFLLSEIATAHAYSETEHAVGKIVIAVQGPG